MRFVVAVPFRTGYYVDYARLLEKHGLLRGVAMWTRNGIEGVPPSKTDLLPLLGLIAYAGARTLSPYRGESLRFALHPLFDRWARTKLQPGDCVLSSYGYANACFRYARTHGGLTFLDGGNAHPAQFWEVLSEEHRRWGCAYPPVSPRHHERALKMMEDVDYVLSPSAHVARSFLTRGFDPAQILDVIYALDLRTFTPSPDPRPKDRPLTLINTGGLSLRKGTPYLLEAFRQVRRAVPDARLLLTDLVTDSMRPLMEKYADLPVEWAPSLPHAQLAERLRSADLYVLPSLEEGLVRTALEGMACGLPAILTPNCGSNDLIVEEVNGSVVPIRDPQAIAERVLAWWERIRTGYRVPVSDLQSQLSVERLEELFIGQIKRVTSGGRGVGRKPET